MLKDVEIEVSKGASAILYVKADDMLASSLHTLRVYQLSIHFIGLWQQSYT